LILGPDHDGEEALVTCILVLLQQVTREVDDNFDNNLCNAIIFLINLICLMNSTIITCLKEIGLDEAEAKIYLALLELDQATVAEIAKVSGIKRTSAYFVLEKLDKDGFVHQTKVETKTLYIAEPPESLLRTQEERIRTFREKLPALAALSNHKPTRAKVLFFDSEEGFKQIWRTLFQSGVKDYLIITDPREMLHFVRKNYITGRIIEEKKERGITSRQLVSSSMYAREIVAKDKDENRVSKILPAGFTLPFTTIVFAENVAYISPYRENIIMIIESPALALTERSKFELLWQSIM